MPDEPTKISCPNCSKDAIKEGNKITCETCDATFTITKTGGARVKESGRLDNIEKRLENVEGRLPGEEPDPANLEPDPANLEPDPANLEPDPADNESILGPR